MWGQSPMTGFAACHAGEPARVLTVSERLVAAAAARRAGEELAAIVRAYLAGPTTAQREKVVEALDLFEAAIT